MNDSLHKITSELDIDEGLLWSGMPRQGLAFRDIDWLMIPFCLLWCGFAFWMTIEIFWACFTAPHPPSIFQLLFLVPFLAVGMYVLFGRFWIDAAFRAKTYYGVTNKTHHHSGRFSFGERPPHSTSVR